MKKWQTLKSEVLHENPWYSLRKDDFETDNGKQGHYYYAHIAGAGMIVPVTNEGKLVVVKQYRYLLGEESLEFPGGGVKEGDDCLETMQNELAEEAGLRARNWVEVGRFMPHLGICDETCVVFIARHLKSVPKPPADELDELVVIELTPKEFEDKIVKQEIKDGMTLAAWLLVKNKINNV